MADEIVNTPKSLRARLDLTQIELATMAGVSERVIRNLEDGEDVSLDSLRRIAAALNVTHEALIAAIDAQRARGAA